MIRTTWTMREDEITRHAKIEEIEPGIWSVEAWLEGGALELVGLWHRAEGWIEPMGAGCLRVGVSASDLEYDGEGAADEWAMLRALHGSWEPSRVAPSVGLRQDVAVLYVEPTGPYPHLVADWFDAERDATTYAGEAPIVAHPPCGPWGRFAWKCTKQDPVLGIIGVAQVRAHGGVLEHPKHSKLWAECGLPKPGYRDAWGYTIEVNQFDLGHEALKPTWLYIVGPEDAVSVLFQNESEAPDTSRRGSVVINRCARKRRLSPGAAAWWLLSIASRCAGYGHGEPVNVATIREDWGDRVTYKAPAKEGA